MGATGTGRFQSSFGPESWDVADWHAALKLASLIQPGLTAAEVERLVKDAARDAEQSNTRRREDQQERREKEGKERKPKQTKWLLPDHCLFYAWILLRSVASWRASERLLTNRLYLAALVAAGLIAPKGSEQTPAWLAAAILDVLRRTPRDRSASFRDKILDPDGRLEEPDEAYALTVRQCIVRICNLTKLEVDPVSGRKGKPTKIAGLNELSGMDYAYFWMQEWPHIRPAGMGRNSHLTVYQREKGNDLQTFHALLCEKCLESVAERDGWQRSIYLPQKGTQVIPINGKGNGGEPREPDPEAARRVRAEFEEEKEDRARAVGRLMISVDGASPVPWTSAERLKPTFSLELFRGTVSLIWHEVDPTGDEVITSSTTYEIGGRQYTILQDSKGVKIAAEGEGQQARSGWLPSWLHPRTFAWPTFVTAVVMAVALLVPTATVNSVDAKRDGVSGAMGQTLNGGVEIQTSLPFLPWSGYTLEVSPEPGRTLSCSYVGPRFPNLSRTAQFQCGPALMNLDLLKVNFTLVERRFGWIAMRSEAIGLGARLHD